MGGRAGERGVAYTVGVSEPICYRNAPNDDVLDKKSGKTKENSLTTGTGMTGKEEPNAFARAAAPASFVLSDIPTNMWRPARGMGEGRAS